MNESLIYLDRNYQEIIKFDDFKLEEDIKEFIQKYSKNNTLCNFYEWLMVVTYYFYKKRSFLQDKDILYSSKEPVFVVYTDKKKKNSFKITEGMVYFLTRFIDSRLFNIPIHLRSSITELIQEIDSTDNENEIKSINFQINKLETELSQRLNKAQGLKTAHAFSKGKIKLFTSIVLRNMNQFSLNIPTDNLTLDSEYKKAKNLIKNKGENPGVLRANKKALDFYNVEFNYFAHDDLEEAYFSMKIVDKNKIAKNPSMELAIENAFKVELKPYNPFSDTENWRPTNSYILVAILKQIALGLGGICKMSDLKKIFAKIFEQVKKENPDFVETQIHNNIEEFQLGNIEDSLNSNLYTEESFKERRYYDTKIKNFVYTYFGDLVPEDIEYEQKGIEMSKYIECIKGIVNSLKNNEKLELSTISENEFIEKGVDFKIHLNFLEFVKKLREPIHINFSPLTLLSKIAVLNENYMLRIKI